MPEFEKKSTVLNTRQQANQPSEFHHNILIILKMNTPNNNNIENTNTNTNTITNTNTNNIIYYLLVVFII